MGNKVTKAIGTLVDNVKYTIGLVISTAYMIYHTFFLKINIASNAAAIQLEDSDATYAIGKAMSTGSVASWIMVAAVLLFVYNAYKLYTINNKSEK